MTEYEPGHTEDAAGNQPAQAPDPIPWTPVEQPPATPDDAPYLYDQRGVPAAIVSSALQPRRNRSRLPLILTVGIIAAAVVTSAVLIGTQLIRRAVPTPAPEVTAPTTSPASTATPTPAPESDDEVRTYDREQPGPTIERAKAAFRKKDPAAYEQVADIDSPAVRPTSSGLAFTWEYVDRSTSRAVEVHRFTVTLDDAGDPVRYTQE